MSERTLQIILAVIFGLVVIAAIGPIILLLPVIGTVLFIGSGTK